MTSSTDIGRQVVDEALSAIRKPVVDSAIRLAERWSLEELQDGLWLIERAADLSSGEAVKLAQALLREAEALAFDRGSASG